MFIDPNSAPSWNSTPNSLRISLSFDSEHRTRSVSWMKIEPFSGFNNPMIDFSSTDLPVPDGPSSTLIAPAGSVNVTSDQMFELPNDFERFLIPTSTPLMRVPPGLVSDLVATDQPLLGLVLCAEQRRKPSTSRASHRQRRGRSEVTGRVTQV